MAGFTDYGTHGTLSTPNGEVMLRPEQYAQFGIVPPPSIEEPVAPLGADPAEMLAPPIVAPTFDPAQVQAEQAAMAQQQAPPTLAGEQPMAQPGPEAVSRAIEPMTIAEPVATPAPEQVQAEAPRAPTNLSGSTFGDVYDAKTGAIGDAAGALAAQSAAEVGNNAAKAAALQQRNDAIAAHEAKAAEEEARRQAAIEKTTADHAAAVKAFADAKVDRNNYRVSPMQWIGVLMSGIGSVAKGEGGKNPALDLLMRQIDQYVDDGYRKKEALGQDAGAVKNHLDVLRGAATDARASSTLVKVGLMEKAARDAEAMLPLMQNREAASRLQLGIADLRGKQAEVFGEGVKAQTDLDHQKDQLAEQTRARKAQVGLGYAQLAENKRQANLDYAAKMMANEEAKAARIGAATSALDVENAKREVADLKMTTVGADGKPTEAMYRAKNEKLGDEVAQMHASVATLDSLMAEAERIRGSWDKKTYPTFAQFRKSPEYQKLTANISAAGIAWAKANQMGAWDNGTAKAVLGAQGGDPMRAGFLDDTIGRYIQGDPNVGLNQFRKNTVTKFNDFAKSVRDPRGGEYVPIEPQPVNFGDAAVKRRTDETVDAIRKDKTPEQIVAGGAAGWSPRLPGERADKFAAQARAASDPSGNLSKNQAAKIDDLATIATTGKNANGTATDPAQAIAGLEALALEVDKNPATAHRALQTLAKIGAEESLAKVEAALASQAKSERDREVAIRPVRLAREAEQRRIVANDPNTRKPPAIAALADVASRGDANAMTMLVARATSRPQTPDSYEALVALQAIQRKKGR